MMPSSSKFSGPKLSPSSASSRPTFTMVYSLRKILVKPRLGKRRCSGIWPPSNPRIREYPKTDLAPLAQRPEFFPRPVPMPWPTRCFLCFCPAGGLNWLRFIAFPFIYSACLLNDRQQMRNLLHHAPESRSIGTLHDPVHFLESQGAYDQLVLFRSANDAAYQLD